MFHNTRRIQTDYRQAEEHRVAAAPALQNLPIDRPEDTAQEIRFMNRRLHSLALGIAAIFIIASWFYYPSWILARFPDDKLQPGTFGDMYGALNTLFSGLAFALLIYTALLQRSELQEQREDLQETRKHVERQTQIQDEQLRLLKEDSERRLELERISRSPKLMLRNFTWGERSVSVTLINGGAPIFDLQAVDYEPKSALACVISSDAILDRNGITKIDFHFPELPQDVSGTYSVVLSYQDVLNTPHQCELSITYKHPSSS